MADWLPDNFKENEIEDAASRAFDSVRSRAAARRKRVCAIRIIAIPTGVLAAVLLILPGFIRRGGRFNPADRVAVSTPGGQAVGRPYGSSRRLNPGRPRWAAPTTTSSSTPVVGEGDSALPSIVQPQSAHSATVTLAKVDHSVELTWKGKPGEKFEVFRCSSPKLDKCSLASVVKGDRWLDVGDAVDDNGSKVVYYRVVPCEPKKGGAGNSASSRFS